MAKWIGRVRFTDGTEMEKEYPFRAKNYSEESEEQYQCESDILCEAVDTGKEVEWYSVDYVEEG